MQVKQSVHVLNCNITSKSGKGVPLRLTFADADDMHNVIQAAAVKYGAGFRILRTDDETIHTVADTAIAIINEAHNNG